MVICDCHTHNGCFHPIYGGLAQLVEHFFCKERVRGSIPLASTGCHYMWRSAAVRRQCLHSSVWLERVLAMYEVVGSNPTHGQCFYERFSLLFSFKIYTLALVLKHVQMYNKYKNKTILTLFCILKLKF